MLAKYMAQQFSHPSGALGRWILGPLWNRRNRALNETALYQLKLQPADRVLEVGFGGGYLLGRMSTIVTSGFIGGVDISAVLVERGQRHYRALIQAGKMDLKTGTADRLPYPEAHFTQAVSVNSIFYWPAAPAVIAELARVLKADGRLVLCFTDRESLRQKDFARHGLTLYNADEVQPLLEAAGFGEVQSLSQTDRHRMFWCVTATKALQERK
jgi:ubiquinone/menaquinone biosynthesis C-methylase UbiE